MKIDRLSIWFFLKTREFHKMGYQEVSSKNIRHFCEDFLWKRHKPNNYKSLKKAIQQITPNQYFDYQTLLIQINTTKDFKNIDFSQLDKK